MLNNQRALPGLVPEALLTFMTNGGGFAAP